MTPAGDEAAVCLPVCLSHHLLVWISVCLSVMQVRNCTNCSTGVEPVEGVDFPSQLYKQMKDATVSLLSPAVTQLQFQLY